MLWAFTSARLENVPNPYFVLCLNQLFFLKFLRQIQKYKNGRFVFLESTWFCFLFVMVLP